jgi:hypothetical protein
VPQIGEGGRQKFEAEVGFQGGAGGLLDTEGKLACKWQSEADFPQASSAAEYVRRCSVHPQAAAVEDQDPVGGYGLGRILGDVDDGDR